MKFKYGDKVKVIGGFYQGTIGIVKMTTRFLFFEREYYITPIEKYDTLEWIDEKDLELVKQK